MEARLNSLMDGGGGQLCARARFWASLRVDGELSELEGALLDAHLGRCDECRAVADDFGAAAHMLRATPQEPVALVAVDLPRSLPRRLLTTVAVAAVLVLGVIAGSIVRGDSSHQATKPPRVVSVVASAETPDQLRRLRRTTLLNMRKLPHELSGEPV